MLRIFYSIFLTVMIVAGVAGVAAAGETDPTVPYRVQEGEAKNKFGYQDKNTKAVVIPPQFDAALLFYNDLAPVAVRNKKNDKLEWGYIDHAGNFVIKPQYTKAYYFSSPAVAIVELTPGKFALINRQGGIVLMAGQTTMNKFFPVWNGLIAVQVGNLWGYANTSGELVILPQYSAAHDFEPESGLARVYRESATGNPMYIDSKNNVVIDEAELNYMGNGFIRGRVGTKWGIFSSDGSVMINPLFDYVGEYSAEGVPVKIGDKWGYVQGGGSGYIISNMGLRNASKTREQVRQEYAGKASTIMIEPRFDEARPFGFVSREAPNPKAVGAVKTGNKWGYVNKEGVIVIKPQFDEALDFQQINSGCKSFCNDNKKCIMAAIVKNNETGCVELNGSYHLASEIKPVEQASSAIVAVSQASSTAPPTVEPEPAEKAQAKTNKTKNKTPEPVVTVPVPSVTPVVPEQKVTTGAQTSIEPIPPTSSTVEHKTVVYPTPSTSRTPVPVVTKPKPAEKSPAQTKTGKTKTKPPEVIVTIPVPVVTPVVTGEASIAIKPEQKTVPVVFAVTEPKITMEQPTATGTVPPEQTQAAPPVAEAILYRMLVGKFPTQKATEPLLRKIKKAYKTAFVRKLDEGYSIQVEASFDEGSVRGIESKLKNQGYEVFILEAKQ